MQERIKNVNTTKEDGIFFQTNERFADHNFEKWIDLDINYYYIYINILTPIKYFLI